jgi:DNA-binding transcriptional regulator YiaG
MIIEFEINGARVIVSGENLSVSLTEQDGQSRKVLPAHAEPVDGVTLKEYLRVSRITQEEFADQVGAHVITVNRWITGNRRPSWSSVRKITQATGGVVTAASWLPSADDMCPTADDIKAYRSAQKLSQHNFAERIGVTQATVSRWETGQERPHGSAAVLLHKMMEATNS